jgi:hypothetical protein
MAIHPASDTLVAPSWSAAPWDTPDRSRSFAHVQVQSLASDLTTGNPAYWRARREADRDETAELETMIAENVTRTYAKPNVGSSTITGGARRRRLLRR